MLVDKVAKQFDCRLKKKLFRNYEIGRARINGHTLYLVKPHTYMNRSGEIFPQLQKEIQVESVRKIIAVDNLDLEPGSVRLKQGGGTAGHNGLKSIVNAIGKSGFLRLFIGIGRPDYSSQVVSWVLSRPEGCEREALSSGIDAAASCVIDCMRMPLEKVMNEYNKKQKADSQS